ncbi:hypothetical protein [Massilia consociata]|uniref:Pyrroline-5-carboxylate reductase n=1 Tax=Massilia consociata TaxID=760117 RepID=A0ABV6FA65_9BURK
MIAGQGTAAKELFEETGNDGLSRFAELVQGAAARLVAEQPQA